MVIQANSVSDGGANPRAQRRRFLRMQLAKAGLGALLGLAFFLMIGTPDTVELVALSGFLIPACLALLALAPIPLSALEQTGLASLAGLIGYLAILTGGVVSPLVVWLVLVPAEAALTGGRTAVLRAGLVAGEQLVSFEDAMAAVPIDGDLAPVADEVATQAAALWRTDGILDAMHVTPLGEVPGSVVAYFATVDSMAHAWDLSASVGRPIGRRPHLRRRIPDRPWRTGSRASAGPSLADHAGHPAPMPGHSQALPRSRQRGRPGARDFTDRSQSDRVCRAGSCRSR
jgi:hypothetical protein